MNESELIAKLAREGISLALDNESNIKLASKTGKVDQDTVAQLKKHKLALVNWLKAQNSENTIVADCTGGWAEHETEGSCGKIFPSSAQERMFFVEKLSSEHFSAFNISLAYCIHGEINCEAFRQALVMLMKRHHVLCSTFRESESGLRVDLLSEKDVEDTRLPFQQISFVKNDAEIKTLLASHAQQKFDLAVAPLFRAYLIQIDTENTYFQLVIHHAIFDGWSGRVLIRDLASFYNACAAGASAQLPDLPVDYYSFVNRQRRSKTSENTEQSLHYWEEQLKDAPLNSTLPYDRIPNPDAGENGACVDFSLSAPLRNAIRELAARCGVTPYLLLLSVFKLCLARFTNVDDVVVGTPVANRDAEQLQNLMGLFVNTLVLRTRFAADDNIEQLVQKVKTTHLDALKHQDVSFEKIVESVNPDREASTTPLFQSLFIYHDFAEDFDGFNGLKVKPADQELHTALYDLTMQFEECGESLRGSILYRSDLYSEASINQLASSYRTVLEGILSAPDSRLSELPLLSADAVASLQTAEQGTALTLPDDSRLQSLFEARASAHPDQPAVRDAHTTLSYADLSTASNRLAHALHAQGIRAGDVVCVSQARSVWSVVAVLGILKAGAIYLPLSTEAGARRGRILEDAGARLMIGEPADDHSLPCLPLRSADDLAAWPDTPVKDSSEDTAAACLLYTSGSSGHPKGVLLSHRGLANRLLWQQQHQPADASDIIAQKTSLNFVDHLAELFQPLLEGALCEVIDDRDMQDFDRFIARLADAGVTRLTLVPSLLRALLAHPGFGELTQLRSLTSSGEALDRELAIAVYRALPQLTLYNYYGSTEVSADALWETVSRDPAVAVSLGQPIANMCAYVLDRHGQLQPPGVAGELHIGGPGLALGYHGDAGDNRRFCHYPWIAQGARLYRSGDLCVRDHAGRLHYRGRLDNQLKIRGMRIDAAEIEQALHRQPDIREAVVGQGEQGELVAWIVPVSADSLDRHTLDRQTRTETWHRALQTDLSRHLVPQAWVLLDSLPRTRTGKLDRRALPAASEADRLQTRYVAPRTARERQLCQLWEELLERPQVGIEDNFFHLGGHSLLASRLLSRLRQSLQIDLPLKALFDHPSIAQLLTWLDSREPTQTTSLAPIPVCARDASLRPSLAQQRLWFLDQLDGRDADYNLPMRFRLGGRLDHRAFRQSLAALIERHEVMRGNIDTVQGQARLVIRDNVSLPLREHDCSHLPADEARAAADRLLADDAAAPFDLGHDVFLRVLLIKLGEDDHLVSFTLHHIAADGWSLGILYREFNACYNALSRGEPLPLNPPRLHYADYAEWQRQWLDSGVREQQLGYWQQQLAGLPSVHSLPLDRPRPAQARAEGHSLQRRLDSRALQQIHRYCRAQGVTLFMFLQTAFALLLQRYSGESDIVMGTPVAGRSHPDTESLLGFFVNNLVLRSRVDGEASFNQLLAANREMILGAFEHQHVPFETLVDALQPERSLSHSPLFQILFTLHNNYWHKIDLDNLELTENVRNETGLKYDLELAAAEQDGGLTLHWHFNSLLFDGESIERMADNFLKLIEELPAQPESLVGTINIMEESEQKRLLVDWNATEDRALCEFDLIGEFEQKVAQFPENLAVADHSGSLSYAELNTRVNKLAALLQSKGLAENSLVAVCLPRSQDMLVSVLAILKAGAGYVPIDPTYPIDRINYMLDNSKSAWVISDADSVAKLSASGELKVSPLILDAEPVRRALSDMSGENPPQKRETVSTAYVIYTSGSTGLPKGVCIPYAALGNFLGSMALTPGMSAGDRLLAVTSISFDIAGLEFYLPLVTGASLFLASAEDVLDSHALQTLLSSQDITFMQATPATWRLLIEEGWQGKKDLKVLCGGEAWPSKLREQLLSRAASVWNMYGPTETTIWSTVDEVRSDAGEMSIGHPIANTQVYILNKQKQPVPQGGIGELFIGGEGLAKGYYEKPELTAEKFISCDFPLSSKIYGTGDLARWRNDGKLQYMGREDQQIKIRGFRIEIEEIEKVLLSFSGVQNAVVVCKARGESDKILVAYVLCDNGAQVNTLERDLRTHCAAHLPHYMVPLRCIILDAFPLTLNNKIDKKSLQAFDVEFTEEDTQKTPLQKQLAEIWSGLLNQDYSDISINRNFFELGGHSLLVVKLINKIKQVFSVSLDIKQVFDFPALKDMSALIEKARTTNSEDECRAALSENAGEESTYLAPSAQQRMYFLQQIDNDRATTYNIPLALEVQGDVTTPEVIYAVKNIVRKHDALRTVFSPSEQNDGLVVAEVLSEAEFEVPVVHVGRSDPSWLLNNNRNAVFDLGCFPLFKVQLLEVASNKKILLFNVHHIVFDGWSIGLFTRELQAFCKQAENGVNVATVSRVTSYQQFAHWQARRMASESYAEHMAYWEHRLASLKAGATHIGSASALNSGSEGAVYELPITTEFKENLLRLCERYDVTLFVLLLGVLNIQLWNYTEQGDIAIGTAVANRNMQEFEDVIGLFVNTLILRNTVDPSLNFMHFIQLVKENVLKDLCHSDVPLEKVIEQMNPDRQQSASPAFQVMLNVQESMQGNEESDLKIVHMPQEWPTAKFDLTLNVETAGESLYAYIEYKTGVFGRRDIEGISADMQEVVRHLANKSHKNLFDLPCTQHAVDDVSIDSADALEDLFQF